VAIVQHEPHMPRHLYLATYASPLTRVVEVTAHGTEEGLGEPG
jgi:hypothetical protein